MTHSEGVNDSERFLLSICNHSFLSLWSHCNLTYLDKRGASKEICDVLVIFENNIIIFSDKEIKFNESKDTVTSWRRWVREAILCSIKQIYGAENNILRNPKNIYFDLASKIKFNQFDESQKYNIYRVAIANGAEDFLCRQFLNRGTFFIDTSIDTNGTTFLKQDTEDYKLGNFKNKDKFVHIFNKISLSIIMNEFDTINDFVLYLRDRELFLSNNNKTISFNGEENLIAHYYLDVKPGQNPSFNLDSLQEINPIQSTSYDYFISRPQYNRGHFEKINFGFVVDSIINYFMDKKTNWTQLDSEEFERKTVALKTLASERRLPRRIIGEAFSEIIEKAKNVPQNSMGVAARRSILSPTTQKTVYIFCIFNDFGILNKEDFYQFRIEYAKAYGAYVLAKSNVIFREFSNDIKDVVILVIDVNRINSENLPEDMDMIWLGLDYVNDNYEQIIEDAEKLEFMKNPQFKHKKIDEFPIDKTPKLMDKMLNKKHKKDLKKWMRNLKKGY